MKFGQPESKAEEACVEALQMWLAALINDFRECGIDERDLQQFFRDYIEAMGDFLQDDEVSAQLLRPFTDSVPEPTLDGRLLVARWQALSLPALPEGFNAERACRLYVERLNQTRQAIDLLRPLWQAQAGQRGNELLRDIRGQWADWDLDLYADAMRETYQALDLTTLQPTGHYDLEAEPIKLRDIFIAQDARRSIPSGVLPRDYLKRLQSEALAETLAEDVLLGEGSEANDHWNKTPREPVLDILTAPNIRHLIILGDPGAGKSCLARYVVLSLLDALGLGQQELRGPLRPWVAGLGERMPFLIELRRFLTWEASGGEGGFVGYLHHLGSTRGFGLNRADLDRYLRTAQSLVLFDGLDEVLDRRKRDEVGEAITGFARTYPPAKVVVTARRAGFDQRPFIQRARGFSIATFDDLDRKQIETFSKTWFRLTLRADPEQAKVRHRHLCRSVRERPQLRALAGNPLLLTVIALIVRRQELPPARAGLCAHALQVFCHHWDFEDKQLELPADSPLRNLDLDDKLAVLRRVAWSMLEKEALRANVIEKGHLEKVIASYFEEELRTADRAMCRRASREMIQVLEYRNYILCQQGDWLVWICP